MSTHLSRDVTHDAVVVVPGIMGSALVERTSGRTLWGLNPHWYAQAWTTPGGLDGLRVTEAERAGDDRRVEARPLRFPAYMPLLGGLEPYTRMVRSLREVVADPAAILNFAYDWRLPVEHNARRLAEAAVRHLTTWRAHPAHDRVRRLQPDGRTARLVLVAHSMGGLLARAMTRIPGMAEEIRATITLGTPFYGSVRAAVILSSGRLQRQALPRQRLREVAVTLPGVYDLLPAYRCVDTGDDFRGLTPADLATLGADPDLATASAAFHDQLQHTALVGHHQLIGLWQPTLQSLTLRDGVVEPHHHIAEQHRDGSWVRTLDGSLKRVDRQGDGTVYRGSAELTDTYVSLPQQHGSLPRTSDVISHVRAIVTARRLGPPQTTGDELGLDLPDIVPVGEPWTFTITGTADPSSLGCVLLDTETGLETYPPSLTRRDGRITATAAVPHPGVYRVEVSGTGNAPLTQLVMAIPHTSR